MSVEVLDDGAAIKLTSCEGPDSRDYHITALQIEPHVSNSVTVRMQRYEKKKTKEKRRVHT